MGTWHKLDNAAKLFPSISKTSNTSIYRISMVLKEDIDPELLQKALDLIVPRFPSFTLRIRRGLFWYYLEEINDRLLVQKESDYPCAPMRSSLHNRFLIKVLYYGRKISLEVYHAIADGSGAFEFLKTLVYQYLTLKGIKITPDKTLLLPHDIPTATEMEDSFKKYYKPLGFHITAEQKPMLIEGTPFEYHGNNVVSGIVSVKKLLAVCRSKNVTITEYLTAIFIYSIYCETAQHKGLSKIINIAIPVNLRKAFPSITLRNFFCVTIISTKVNKNMDFEDILEQVKFYMKQKTSKEYLEHTLSSNGKIEHMMVSRFIPLFIKDLFIDFGAKNFGEKYKTSTITNMGQVKVPPDMAPHIELAETTLYPTTLAPISCGISSINDQLTITFARTIIETKIIRHFFTYLATETDLEVKIYSNNWGTDYE